jgi:hypothetical protein
MNLFEKLRLLEHIHLLIRRKATGSPKELAQRLEQSERTIYRIIEEMRNAVFPIEYCKVRCSYYYPCDVEFSSYNLVVLDKKDSNLLHGGKKISFFEKNFLTASFWQ